jgi:hypothetical protein
LGGWCFYGLYTLLSPRGQGGRAKRLRWFGQEPVLQRGFGERLERSISLQESQLIIELLCFFLCLSQRHLFDSLSLTPHMITITNSDVCLGAVSIQSPSDTQTQQAKHLNFNETNNSKACTINHGHIKHSHSAQRAQGRQASDPSTWVDTKHINPEQTFATIPKCIQGKHQC